MNQFLSGFSVICDEALSHVYLVTEIIDMPNGPATIPAPGINNVNLFPTNLNGIGVAIAADHNLYPFNGRYRKVTSLPKETHGNGYTLVPRMVSISAYTYYYGGSDNELDYGVVDGRSFPTVRFYITTSAAGDFDESAFNLMQYAFNGAITLSNPTCNAVNNTVNLGTHQSDAFPHVGSGTAWVNSSLNIECDSPFNGGASTQLVSYKVNSDGLESVLDRNTGPQNNKTSIKIHPVDGYTENMGEYAWGDIGIISLSESVDAASGIGIQLSQTESEDIEEGLVKYQDALWAYSSAEVGSRSFTIPLYARYIRTGDVTPGRADSLVEYTLNYK
ncbi:TPA: type 1 fimbrial protein [Klebsiella michiganensis]|nr:type 1 fimbrial protein [Klebsiella michiganensis]